MKRPKTPAKKKAFIQQVADLAKVSPATVSRVARGRSTVAADMRERVFAAAKTLGVDLGQRLNERSSVIAFIVSNRDSLSSFQARVLWGAEAYCASQQRELLFMSFQYSPATPAKDLHLPEILNDRAVLRALILSGTNSPNMLAALEERDVPFAVLGNNVLGDWNDEAYDVLYSDDVQGAYDLTRHLISQGHKDVWFFGDTDLPWYSRCAKGYRAAMTQSGLEPRLSEIHSDAHQLGYMAMRSALSRNEPLTAVFAGSDQIARGVYEALRQAEMRVPDDISVAAFNDTEAALMDPPLTSVREFPEELGKHLAEFVLRRTREPARKPQQLTIPTRVIVRDSTKAAEASSKAAGQRLDRSWR